MKSAMTMNLVQRFFCHNQRKTQSCYQTDKAADIKYAGNYFSTWMGIFLTYSI